MLGVFAEFETNISGERQLEGIAKAKEKVGILDVNQLLKQVVELISQGLTKKAVANELEIGVASVYRILKTYL